MSNWLKKLNDATEQLNEEDYGYGTYRDLVREDPTVLNRLGKMVGGSLRFIKQEFTSFDHDYGEAIEAQATFALFDSEGVFQGYFAFKGHPDSWSVGSNAWYEVVEKLVPTFVEKPEKDSWIPTQEDEDWESSW